MTQEQIQRRDEEIRQCIEQHPEWCAREIGASIHLADSAVRRRIRAHPEWSYTRKQPKRSALYTPEQLEYLRRLTIAHQGEWTMKQLAVYSGLTYSQVCDIVHSGKLPEYTRPRPDHGAQIHRRRRTKSPVSPQKSITELAREARACGMTYGQYCARIAREETT